MANLEESGDDGYAGMSGMTTYNRVEGEFFLRQMPSPDEQMVRQTIQGVIDEFIYQTDELSLQSILKENEQVSVTENVYLGDTSSVANQSVTSFSTDSSGNPFNRMVIQAGVGSYSDTMAATLSSSVHDEIIAIAVDDIKPFMIKGLDTDHTAELVNDKPTNDGYIKHLSPSKQPLIASIESPTILTDAGGPKRVLVFYDAIDLTGEVIAGNTLTPSQVNAHQRPYHVEGENKGYLVVKKTIPASSTLYEVSSGTYRTLSDILLKPYSSAPANNSDVQMKITAAGGLITLPTKDFKQPIKSHVLKSHAFEGSFPSPFIDISDCVLTVKDNLKGYGRPRTVANSNTPDETSNPSHHVMTIQSNIGKNLEAFDSTKRTPPELSRSTLQVFNIIDNEVSQNDNTILVIPANRNRYAVLDDFLTSTDHEQSSVVSLEIALLNGRAEEFNTKMDNGGASLELRGRSNLMDMTSKETKRNLNLGESVPIKEIGDTGTPTVSITLGGVGQGGVDTKPEWTEHPFLPGWKDRIVGSGNASVRNDRQTSTDYASTRALVELPLFPSMFYDVNGIYEAVEGITDGVHPFGKDFEITIDCTMTAKNRVQMRNYEARNSVDWGFQDSAAAVEISNPIIHRNFLGAFGNFKAICIKAQKTSIQAIVTAHDLTLGTANSYITVDDVEPFINETIQGVSGPQIDSSTGVLTNKFYITVGEGVVKGYAFSSNTIDQTDGVFLMMRVHKIENSTNKIYVDRAIVRNQWRDFDLNLTAVAPTASSKIFNGAVVTYGGAINFSRLLATGEPTINASSYTTDGVADAIEEGLKQCLGLASSAITKIETNRKTYVVINVNGQPSAVDIGGFEFDVWNKYGFDNNRELKEPIICHPNFTGLKGKSAQGTSLQYVLPSHFNFRDIALKSDGFESSVNELIRQINMAGHPKAKNSFGASAYETPLQGANKSGGHMGYVRAFIGKEVESRSGEKGVTIVIHSTVPGASGREFAVWLSNKSVYPYRPIQAIGHGGLLATNSRSYQMNSFPAPMPIGADGETFVPITTFTGAPHGSIIHPEDQTETIRSYNGIGTTFKAKTKSTDSSTLQAANGSFSWDDSEKLFDHITVEGKAMDYMLRTSSTYEGINGVDPNQRGSRLLRIGGMLATFSSVEYNPVGYASIGENEAYLHRVIPLSDPDRFVEEFYDGAFNTFANEITGMEVEFLYPAIDQEAILFFGGGHTGLTFDISDGTDNDYSDFYKHPLAKGSTGFAGFQNLGEMSSPFAVLDFTDVLNEDTINSNTLRGFHHTTVLNSDNEPEGKCAFYARLQNGIYGSSEDLGTGAVSQDNTKWREDLYNRKVRVTSANGMATTKNGVTNGVEVTPTGSAITAKLFAHGDVVALHNNNSGTIEAEHAEVKSFDPGNANYCISAICAPPASNPNYMTGPIFHAIYDDGTPNGRPYGLHLGASSPSSGEIPISVALTCYNPTPFPGQPNEMVAVLVPSTVSGGTVKVDETGYTFIMMGQRDVSAPVPSFLYIGNTVGITNPATGLMTAGIFDFSDYVVRVNDEQYNHGFPGASPNAKSNFETETSGYGGGDADHPDLPSAIHSIRDKEMATIGCALIGAPFINILGGTTQGGHALTPINDYFTALQSGSPTYGVTGTGGSFGDGKNSAGPIHFAGYLTDVALWKRYMSFTEASNWFASYNKW